MKKVLACVTTLALLLSLFSAFVIVVDAADLVVSNFEAGDATFTTSDPNGLVTVDTTEISQGLQSVKLKAYNQTGFYSITQYLINKTLTGIVGSSSLTFWVKSTVSFKMKVTIADDSWGAGLEKIIDIAEGTNTYTIPLSEMGVGSFNGNLRCIVFRIDYQYEGQPEFDGDFFVDALKFTAVPQAVAISDFEDGSATFTTGDPTGAVTVDTNNKYDGIQSSKLKIFNQDGDYAITQYVLNKTVVANGEDGNYLTFWAKSTVSFKMKITIADDSWANAIFKVVDIYAGTKMYSVPLSEMTGAFNGTLRCIIFRIDYLEEGQSFVDGFMSVDALQFTPTDLSADFNPSPVLISDLEDGSATFTSGDPDRVIAVDTNYKYDGVQSSKIKIVNQDGSYSITQYILNKTVAADESGAYLTFWAKSTDSFKMKVTIADDSWSNVTEKIIDISAGTYLYSIPLSEMVGTFNGTLRCIIFRIDYQYEGQPFVDGFMNVDALQFTPTDLSADLNNLLLVSDFEDGSATFTSGDPDGVITVDTTDKYEGYQSSKLKIVNLDGSYSITQYILNKTVVATGEDGNYLTFWAKSTDSFKMKVTIADDSWSNVTEKIIDISAGTYLYSIPLSEMVGTFNGTLRCIILRIDYQYEGQPEVNGFMNVDALQFTTDDLSADLNPPTSVLISDFEDGSATFTSGDTNGVITVDTTKKYDGIQSSKLKIFNQDGDYAITQYLLGKTVVTGETGDYLSFWARSTVSFKMKVSIYDDSWVNGVAKIIDISAGTYLYSIPLSEMTGTFNGTLRCIIFRIDYQYECQFEVDGFMNVDALQFTPDDLSANLTPSPVLISDFEDGSSTFSTGDPNGEVTVDTTKKYDGAQSSKLKIFNQDGSYAITAYGFGKSVVAGDSGDYISFWAKSTDSFKLKVIIYDDSWSNAAEKIIDISAGTYLYSIPISSMTGIFNGTLRYITFRIDYQYEGQPEVNGFMNVDALKFSQTDLSADLNYPPVLISDFEDGSATFTTADPNGAVTVDTDNKYDGIQSSKLKIFNQFGSYAITAYGIAKSVVAGQSGVYLTFWAKSTDSFKMKVIIYDDSWSNAAEKIIDVSAGTYLYSIPLSEMTCIFNGTLRYTTFRIDYQYEGQPEVNGFMNVDAIQFTAEDLSVKIRSAFMYGDIDGDGEIIITDLVAMKQHLLCAQTLSGDSLLAVDVDRSGNVSISDLLILKKHLLGLLTISQS